jgi:hypothetical protein
MPVRRNPETVRHLDANDERAFLGRIAAQDGALRAEREDGIGLPLQLVGRQDHVPVLAIAVLVGSNRPGAAEAKNQNREEQQSLLHGRPPSGSERSRLRAGELTRRLEASKLAGKSAGHE